MQIREEEKNEIQKKIWTKKWNEKKKKSEYYFLAEMRFAVIFRQRLIFLIFSVSLTHTISCVLYLMYVCFVCEMSLALQPATRLLLLLLCCYGRWWIYLFPSFWLSLWKIYFSSVSKPVSVRANRPNTQLIKPQIAISSLGKSKCTCSQYTQYTHDVHAYRWFYVNILNAIGRQATTNA